MSCNGLIEVISRKLELEQLERERQRVKTELECYRLAREIYDFLDKYEERKRNHDSSNTTS